LAEQRKIFALVAEFSKADALVDAVDKLRAGGWDAIEAYSPFPIEGLSHKEGFSSQAVPTATLIGGMVGAISGFLIQAYANWDFPLDVGGRPLIAVQAFALIIFELTVLCAVLATVGTMLVANRLPRLNHPLFDAQRFSLGYADRFFIAMFAHGDWDEKSAHAALRRLRPVSIEPVHAVAT
jgi:hypothetical protein